MFDKNMKKMDIVENENIGISSSTLAKMSRGENVSMSILEKICMELDCDFGDLIHYEKDESKKCYEGETFMEKIEEKQKLY